MLRCWGSLLLVACLVAVPTASTAPASRGGPIHASSEATSAAATAIVLGTTRPVEQLAADGSRVAMRYLGGGQAPCVGIWNVSTGAVDSFPGTAGLCPGLTADDRPIEITEIALAGERVLWSDAEHNAHTYWHVLTATLKRRAPAGVYNFSSGDSSHVRGLRGDGELLVFAVFDPEALKPRAKLFRARPLKLLRGFPRGVRLISVDRQHIVVGVREGSLEVLNHDGRLLRTLDVRVSDVSAAVLHGGRVVVQRGRSLLIYDARTGNHMKTLSIAGGRVVDFHRGLVVYVTDTAVRLVRLADGRDIVLATPTQGFGEGPLRAELEAPGLFYSFVNYKRDKPGRVVFVPFGTLQDRLR